jgi:hypothetical protein
LFFLLCVNGCICLCANGCVDFDVNECVFFINLVNGCFVSMQMNAAFISLVQFFQVGERLRSFCFAATKARWGRWFMSHRITLDGYSDVIQVRARRERAERWGIRGWQDSGGSCMAALQRIRDAECDLRGRSSVGTITRLGVSPSISYFLGAELGHPFRAVHAVLCVRHFQSIVVEWGRDCVSEPIHFHPAHIRGGVGAGLCICVDLLPSAH